MTDEELAGAVHWLLDSRDPDVAALVRNVQQARGDLIDWAKANPEMLMQLHAAALDMVEQAPADELLRFTTNREITVNDRESRK